MSHKNQINDRGQWKSSQSSVVGDSRQFVEGQIEYLNTIFLYFKLTRQCYLLSLYYYLFRNFLKSAAYVIVSTHTNTHSFNGRQTCYWLLSSRTFHSVLKNPYNINYSILIFNLLITSNKQNYQDLSSLLHTRSLLTFVNCLFEAKLNALFTSSSLTKIPLITLETTVTSFVESRQTQGKRY